MGEVNQKKKLRKKKLWFIVGTTTVCGALLVTDASAVIGDRVLDPIRRTLFQITGKDEEESLLDQQSFSTQLGMKLDPDSVQKLKSESVQSQLLDQDYAGKTPDPMPEVPPPGGSGGRDSAMPQSFADVPSPSEIVREVSRLAELPDVATVSQEDESPASPRIIEKVVEKVAPEIIEKPQVTQQPQVNMDLSKLSKEQQELQKRLIEEKSELDKLEYEKTNLQSVVGELEGWIQEHDEDVKDLNEFIEDDQNELATTDEQLTNGKDSEGSPLTAEARQKLEARQEKLGKRIQRDKNKRDKLLKKLSDRRAILEERKSKLSKLEQDLIEKQKQIAELEARSKALNSEENDTEQSNAASQQIADLTAERDTLKAKLDALEGTPPQPGGNAGTGTPPPPPPPPGGNAGTAAKLSRLQVMKTVKEELKNNNNVGLLDQPIVFNGKQTSNENPVQKQMDFGKKMDVFFDPVKDFRWKKSLEPSRANLFIYNPILFSAADSWGNVGSHDKRTASNARLALIEFIQWSNAVQNSDSGKQFIQRMESDTPMKDELSQEEYALLTQGSLKKAISLLDLLLELSEVKPTTPQLSLDAALKQKFASRGQGNGNALSTADIDTLNPDARFVSLVLDRYNDASADLIAMKREKSRLSFSKDALEKKKGYADEGKATVENEITLKTQALNAETNVEKQRQLKMVLFELNRDLNIQKRAIDDAQAEIDNVNSNLQILEADLGNKDKEVKKLAAWQQMVNDLLNDQNLNNGQKANIRTQLETLEAQLNKVKDLEQTDIPAKEKEIKDIELKRQSKIEEQKQEVKDIELRIKSTKSRLNGVKANIANLNQDHASQAKIQKAETEKNILESQLTQLDQDLTSLKTKTAQEILKIQQDVGINTALNKLNADLVKLQNDLQNERVTLDNLLLS